MTGVAVQADVRIAVSGLNRLTTEQLEPMAYEAGALIEDQTKLRVMDEKTDPDGNAWAPWSKRYTKTRNPHHTLLVDTGNPGLLESLQNHTTGKEAEVGTSLIYGTIHQFGSEDGALPARSYLGVSVDNRGALEDLVIDQLEELLQ